MGSNSISPWPASIHSKLVILASSKNISWSAAVCPLGEPFCCKPGLASVPHPNLDHLPCPLGHHDCKLLLWVLQNPNMAPLPNSLKVCFCRETRACVLQGDIYCFGGNEPLSLVNSEIQASPLDKCQAFQSVAVIRGAQITAPNLFGSDTRTHSK